jgi:FdrA protein
VPVRRLLVRPNAYVDSVQLMRVTRAMEAREHVGWAAAVMATPANKEILVDRGFDADPMRDASANDLVLAVSADSAESAEAALAEGEGAAAVVVQTVTSREPRAGPRSLGEAVATMPGANLALVSIPGAFAALEVQKALSAGMHVLLFSDNVSIEDEVALKTRAAELGLLVMGPGAGTASFGGVGLGFANVVRQGPVAIVAAAGTGAQEVMSLIHRWGGGVRHVIGIGGRDLSAAVGGRMAGSALRYAYDDPDVDVVVLVSKPPADDVAASLVAGLGSKPTVVAMIGLERHRSPPEGVRLARTLDEAAALAVQMLGLTHPEVSDGLVDAASGAAGGLAVDRLAIHGLYSGGTLCYEAMVVLSDRLGPIHSNIPLREGWGMPAPPGAHVFLDLGEEEYTRGRPHPMIDPAARAELIASEGAAPDTAVVLIDVVLGHASHDDPASVLAPACESLTRRPDGPVVVAYVLGTDGDPQGLESQRERLAEAGCVLAPTGARAALLAGAIATRRPELAGETP